MIPVFASWHLQKRQQLKTEGAFLERKSVIRIREVQKAVELIKTKSELIAYLKHIGYNKKENEYRIAVEALIFTPAGKLLLEKRGPLCRDEVGKLEGVGGRLKQDDLLYELHEEFDEELAAEAQELEIEIDRMLEIRQVQFEEKDKGLQDWIVVSYLCRLKKGIPAIGEPGKIESLHEVDLQDLYAMEEARLSNSTIAARKVYQARFGNCPYYEVAEKNV